MREFWADGREHYGFCESVVRGIEEEAQRLEVVRLWGMRLWGGWGEGMEWRGEYQRRAEVEARERGVCVRLLVPSGDDDGDEGEGEGESGVFTTGDFDDDDDEEGREGVLPDQKDDDDELLFALWPELANA